MLFFFQQSYADPDVENYFEARKEVRSAESLVFSQFGLSLNDNESILETLPNCEVLKEQNLFTHVCRGDEITYALNFYEAKRCNKDFESRRLMSESINEWKEKNEKLPFNYCLGAFRVITKIDQSSLRNKIANITNKYGPPSIQKNQVKRPEANLFADKSNQKTGPIVLDQTLIWDPYEDDLNEFYNQDEVITDNQRKRVRLRIHRDDPDWPIFKDNNEVNNEVKIVLDTFFKSIFKERRFDFLLWFQWTISLLFPLIYIALSSQYTKGFMKSSFSKNKGNVHYADNTFKRYVTMYLYPAGFQLFINGAGFLIVGFVLVFGGIREDIWCRILTPGFCDAISDYNGNYQLLMTIAVIYTLQLIILVYNAKRMGERYLLRKK